MSRRWLDDPPLDLPPAPGRLQRPAAWLALLHAALAVLGAALLVHPGLVPFPALATPAQVIQVLASSAAAWSALNRAVTDALFWSVELEAPDDRAAGEPIAVRARVVPYRRTRRVFVQLSLVSNTYETRARTGRSGIRTRSVVVARRRLLGRGELPGRRASLFEASFDAPYPSGAHRDVAAELEASLLAAFGWLVPSLGERARNLREHGGIYVRLDLRVGPWRRRLERRVLVHHLRGDRLDAA